MNRCLLCGAECHRDVEVLEPNELASIKARIQYVRADGSEFDADQNALHLDCTVNFNQSLIAASGKARTRLQ